MNSIKVIAATVLSAAALASARAEESYLYWMVDDATDAFKHNAVDFSYATVRLGNPGDPSDPSDSTAYLHVYDQETGARTDGWKVNSNGSNSTGPVYSGVILPGDYSGNILVELWSDGDSASLLGWHSYTMSSLRDYIWSSPTTTAGATPLHVSSVVPEPTSGLLLLLGVAGLALRRRRGGHAGRVTLPNGGHAESRGRGALVATALCLVLGGAAFGAANDARVSFSTKGPDTYADGTTVLDGECYALVWTPRGSEGVTIAADGTATGGEIVLAAPLAKGGRCPSVLFQVGADDIATKYANGSWGVYLLDTRRWGADGAAKPAGTANGRLRLVNAAGLVADAKVAAAGAARAAGGEAVAGAATAVPEGTPRPEIVGVKVEGAYVYVTVKGTVPYLQYDLASGATPDAVTGRVDAPKGGAESVDEEIILVAPAKSASGFFKVGRR